MKRNYPMNWKNRLYVRLLLAAAICLGIGWYATILLLVSCRLTISKNCGTLYSTGGLNGQKK